MKCYLKNPILADYSTTVKTKQLDGLINNEVHLCTFCTLRSAQ